MQKVGTLGDMSLQHEGRSYRPLLVCRSSDKLLQQVVAIASCVQLENLCDQLYLCHRVLTSRQVAKLLR